ncbi:MAG TPA: hypothetical protein GXX20_06995 [Clostridiaceae bacterium]|nr:hypothetical protein [Clostridiaceae bacterium]
MNTFEKKLRHFNKVILRDANSIRDEILKRTSEDIEKQKERRRNEMQALAEETLKKEISKAEKEKNYAISKAIIESRQKLMKTRDEVIEQVFEQVMVKLYDFIQGDDYYTFLAGLIRESCTIAGQGELLVYITSRDMEKYKDRIDELSKSMPYTPVFHEAEEDIIGGCRVINKTLNIVVDNTIIRKLNESREKFFESSGLIMSEVI